MWWVLKCSQFPSRPPGGVLIAAGARQAFTSMTLLACVARDLALPCLATEDNLLRYRIIITIIISICNI
jgi:hypothetical protein